jgi:hypothetical protein
VAARLPIQIAVAPNRFAAFATASRGTCLPREVSGTGAEAIISPGALKTFLIPLPVSVLTGRLDTGERKTWDLVATLKRLGIRPPQHMPLMSASEAAFT